MNVRLLSGVLLMIGSLCAAPKGEITFHKDVVPVLQRNCQGCHRPGEPAPMSFLTYAETRPWAKAIKQAATTRKMPPWFADPNVGHFKNNRSMPESDIALLAAWADSGAAEGDPKDAPEPMKFAEGWAIGKPDHVIEMPAAFEVPKDGKVDYQYVIVPSGITEDKWVKAVESRPGNRALTHHIIAFVRQPGSKWLSSMKPGQIFTMNDVPKEERDGMRTAEWFSAFAPGTPPEVMGDGQAKLIKAGSDVVLQLHYTTNGTAGSDKSKVGFVFANYEPKERVMTIPASTSKFTIPAGSDNYPVNFDLTFQGNGRLLTIFPHMHARGKAMTVRLKQPDADSLDLLKMRWDFNWQLGYELMDPIAVKQGTKIEATALYDNSANNPFNPDPMKAVGWGEQTWDEMAMAILNIAFDAKMDPAELLRPPKKPAAAASAAGVE